MDLLMSQFQAPGEEIIKTAIHHTARNGLDLFIRRTE
jgi:hypothetical protein